MSPSTLVSAHIGQTRLLESVLNVAGGDRRVPLPRELPSACDVYDPAGWWCSVSLELSSSQFVVFLVLDVYPDLRCSTKASSPSLDFISWDKGTSETGDMCSLRPNKSSEGDMAGGSEVSGNLSLIPTAGRIYPFRLKGHGLHSSASMSAVGGPSYVHQGQDICTGSTRRLQTHGASTVPVRTANRSIIFYRRGISKWE